MGGQRTSASTRRRRPALHQLEAVALPAASSELTPAEWFASLQLVIPHEAAQLDVLDAQGELLRAESVGAVTSGPLPAGHDLRVPLAAGGRQFGSIRLQRTEEPFSQTERSFLMACSWQVTAAIQALHLAETERKLLEAQEQRTAARVRYHSLAQVLAGIKLQVDLIERKCCRDPDELQQRFSTLAAQLRDALQELRQPNRRQT